MVMGNGLRTSGFGERGNIELGVVGDLLLSLSLSLLLLGVVVDLFR